MRKSAKNVFDAFVGLVLVASCGTSNGTGGESDGGALDGTSSSGSGSGGSGGSSGGSGGTGSGASSGASSGAGSSGTGSSGAGSSGSGSGSGSGGSSGSGSTSGSSSGSGSGSGSSGSSSGSDAGTLACGPYSCDAVTQFCYEAGGGAILPDAGSNFTYACNPIPTQCLANPTCACIIAADAGTHGCPCNVQPGGALLAACLYP